jgi:hypothetical protein
VKLLVAAGVAALLLLGCSSDAAPTKVQYTGAADGVCRAAHDELVKKAEAHFAESPDDGANQRFVRADVIPRLRTMTGELRGIPAPENDGGYLADIYNSYDHALDLWYSDPLGPTSARAGEAAEARMDSYGMKVCAEAGDIEVDGQVSG